jgi:hypothetical protein
MAPTANASSFVACSLAHSLYPKYVLSRALVARLRAGLRSRDGAGASSCHSREGGNPVGEMVASSVIAVKCGVWVPAFAGMTARRAR